MVPETLSELVDIHSAGSRDGGHVAKILDAEAPFSENLAEPIPEVAKEYVQSCIVRS